MKKINLLFVLYFLLFLLFTLYSYAFLDVGLTLTSFKPYLEFQKNMRYFGYSNRPKSTIVFISICFVVYGLYLLLSRYIRSTKISINKIRWLSLLIGGMLIFSYPAFSHDIFNYIFNAKMVLVYHANPHKVAAWNFPDPMLDFMRNVHTTAPYFYGWTLISLLPSVLSFNRIFLSLVNFKFFSLCLFLLSFFFLEKLVKKLKLGHIDSRLTLFLLNPLILIETIGVGHNDFAMMLPAILSFYFLIRFKEEKKLKFIFYSLLLILFSIATKYATVILLPLFIIWYFTNNFDLGLWGAILLFLLPFLRPLDQLHSWYLIWPLTWVFLAKNIKVVHFFCFLSFFSLLRYAPYVWYGNWDPPVPLLRLIIYFALPLLLLPFFVSQDKDSKLSKSI